MRSKRVSVLAAVLGAAMVLPLASCSDYKSSGGESKAQRDQELISQSDQTVDMFKKKDPTLKKFFDTAVGYAVFPEVAKGAVGIGAAAGGGVLYEKGKVVGYVDLAQGSIGLQLGGQTYRELIFFSNTGVLQTFKDSNMEFQAQASAVAAESGAGGSADWENGVAVFTMARGGLMFEASIGGQKFTYRPR